MNKFYTGLKAAALTALTAFLIVLSVTVWDAKKAIDHLDVAVSHVDAALNDPTNGVAATMKHSNAVLNNVNGTVVAIKKAANDQSEYWTLSAEQTLDLIGSATKAVDHIVAVTDKAGTLLDTTNQTVADLQPVEAATEKTITAVQPPLDSLNKAINDPEIHATIVELHGAASDGHRLSKHYVDKWLAVKSKLRKVGDAIGDVGAVVHKWLPPIF